MYHTRIARVSEVLMTIWGTELRLGKGNSNALQPGWGRIYYLRAKALASIIVDQRV